MTETIADMIRARRSDDATALLFEDARWSYREYVAACEARACWLLSLRTEGPFHVGLLLENVPEYLLLLGGAALAGAAVVGINPTRRGAQLERDIRHTDCQILVTESASLGLLEGLDLPMPPERRFVIDAPAWPGTLRPFEGQLAPERPIDPQAPYLLIFTSGTTGDPKAALCSQGRIASVGRVLTQMQSLSARDVGYLVMPLFHSNALLAGWAPMLAAGAAVALRRRFSASGFLPDVRRHGCTYMNYVGKPLTYILATPEQPDDADNPLQRVFGNEAAARDIERFEKRFACRVTDGYGSTEGGISISRTPDTPAGALGVGTPGTRILDRETGAECPPARFSQDGRLENAEQAIGEIANDRSASSFEGYWRNQEADVERTQGGIYWSGDLGYRDERGFLYFAGRNHDWLRVDGENFAAAPVEAILMRLPGVMLAAVYAAPSAEVGDEVMAALLFEPGCDFDAAGFPAFLAAQSDLGTKAAPRYVRVARELPATPSNKILKRELRDEAWECGDPVFWRQADGSYRQLTSEDARRIRAAFEARGRAGLLPSH